LLLIALAAAPGFTACSSSGEGGLRSEPDPISTYGIEREGDASAAQLNTFLHHKARDWAWAGGQFDAPDDNAVLSADTPQTFSFHADPADFAEGGAPDEIVMTHLLQFSRASGSSLLQVFTTLSEYTPNAQDWQKLVDAGEPITLSLTTGSFVGSGLPQDGGPFIGQTITFTIE
jgi:hypothetical protein